MGIRKKAWELESRLPGNVKKVTDRVIRGAHTWGRDSKREGEKTRKALRRRLGLKP